MNHSVRLGMRKNATKSGRGTEPPSPRARRPTLFPAPRLRPVVYPLGRLAKVLLAAKARPALEPLGESVVSFRVWPGDLDTNRHLNNGRYLTLMDLGRWDLMARNGLLAPVVKRRWMPVVGAATMRFRRSLDPFQKYDLRTRLLGWDERAFFLGQSFAREGDACASGAVRAVLLGREGRVAPQRVVDLVAPGLASPALPPWVRAWSESMDAQAAHERDG